MHPNNIHNEAYPLVALQEKHLPLKKFIHHNSHGKETIDFANPEAVFHLNKALLKHYYRVTDWNIPSGYLCPPIPSRVDYLHHLNDLLHEKTPSDTIKIVDIGTGANCIYALLAHQVFQWDAVGCDIDIKAVHAAQENVNATIGLSEHIEIRHQDNNTNILDGVIATNEYYHASVCNPPFYASAEDANSNTLQKLKKLNSDTSKHQIVRNFKGQPNELWCNGGEALFIKRMIKQSVAFQKQVGWFTTLISKGDNLPKLLKLLNKLKAKHRIIEMKHGSKITRMLAWHF